MSLERIAAIGQANPVRRMVDAPPRRAYPGFAQVAAADRLQAGAADALLRTAGDAGSPGSEISAGDVLLVKVLAVTPKLELAVFEPGSRQRGAASDSDQPAMRPDQLAWQRQLVTRPPEGVGLASAWRTTMLEQLELREAPRGPGDETDASWGRSAFPADAEAARLKEAATSLYRPLPSNDPSLQPWVLTAYAWGGLRVLLRLLAVERDAPPPSKRRTSAVALRLALVLDDLGGVVVQLQLTPDGVQLDFAVERAASQQALRDKLPLVIAAVARADLSVARCRVAGGLLGEVTSGAPGAPTAAASAASAALALTRLVQSHPSTAAALPLDLFRAAAEVVLALSSI